MRRRRRTSIIGRNMRPYWPKRGAKSVISTQPPLVSTRRVRRIAVFSR
jgi:hypothetical protein